MEMAMVTGHTSVKVNSGGSGGISTERGRDLLQTEETRATWGLPLTPSGESTAGVPPEPSGALRELSEVPPELPVAESSYRRSLLVV